MGGAVNPTRLYDGNFAIAFASQICFVLASSLMAHYARWITFLRGDERHVGLIMGLAPVISLLFRPWVGPWIDRLGVRRTWTIGQVVVAVALPLNLVFAEVGPGLFLLRMVTTLGFAVVFASSLTYVTTVAPAGRRTEAIGVFGAAGFVGMLFGPAIGDVTLGATHRERSDFAWYFVVMTIAVVASSVLLAFVRPLPRSERTSAIHFRSFVRTARRYWPGTILLVNVVFGVCMTVPFGFLAEFIDDVHLQEWGIGGFFLCYAGWGLFIRLALRDLPDRLGRRRFLLLGMFAFGLGSLSFLFVHAEHGWRLVIPAILCGTGHALVFHTMVSLALESFPPEARGTGSVVVLTHLDLGQIAGAPILGQLAFHSGYEYLFVTVSLSCFFAVAVYAGVTLLGTSRSRSTSY
jgi:MFS family permease